MYKIISISDKKGKLKKEFINELKLSHPNLIGNFMYYDIMKLNLTNKISSHCYFEWLDESGKMLKTSLVEKIKEYKNAIEITTMNSIYIFRNIIE